MYIVRSPHSPLRIKGERGCLRVNEHTGISVFITCILKVHTDFTDILISNNTCMHQINLIPTSDANYFFSTKNYRQVYYILSVWISDVLVTTMPPHSKACFSTKINMSECDITHIKVMKCRNMIISYQSKNLNNLLMLTYSIYYSS